MLKIVFCSAFIGHVLCGVCDCLLSYSPSGRLDPKAALKDPEKMKTVAAMIIAYLALAVFLVTLFVMTVSGKTVLTWWACIFYTLPLMLILVTTKLGYPNNIGESQTFQGRI